MAYLADIIDLYLTLQGKAITSFGATDKVEALKETSIKNGILDCLPQTKQFGDSKQTFLRIY